MNAAEPLRAPNGAVGWSPASGWLYSANELAGRVDGDTYALTVSGDGMLRGVQPHDTAPLRALLRVEDDVAELVACVDDLADRVEALDVSEATDTNELHARLTALVHRVDLLERGPT